MAKAQLSFEKIAFIALPGLCTVGKITLQEHDNHRVDIAGATITNKGKGDIEISIVDQNDQFVPKGFVLTLKSGSAGDWDGMNNFNSRSHNEGL